jgi:hypothetical protein
MSGFGHIINGIGHGLRTAAVAVTATATAVSFVPDAAAQQPGRNIAVKPEANRFGGTTLFFDYSENTKSINVGDAAAETKVTLAVGCRGKTVEVIYGVEEPGKGMRITQIPKAIENHAKHGYCGRPFNRKLMTEDVETALERILSARKPATPGQKQPQVSAKGYSAG